MENPKPAPGPDPLDSHEEGRIAGLTGMTADAAKTFLDFHTGRSPATLSAPIAQRCTTSRSARSPSRLAEPRKAWTYGRRDPTGPSATVWPMTQDEDQDRTEPAVEGLDDGDAGRQIAHVTGMSADAAATFAAFHSGRFAHRSSFRDAA
jgi:hypothetical protein